MDSKRVVRPLSNQQRLFVDYYMQHFNAKKAAEEAGYSMSNGSVGTSLMRRPQIEDEIRRRSLEAQKKLDLGADDVRRGFAKIATDPREPKLGGPSYEARLVAWRELGKLLGMYSTKIQVSGSITLLDLLNAADSSKVVAEQTPAH